MTMPTNGRTASAAAIALALMLAGCGGGEEENVYGTDVDETVTDDVEVPNTIEGIDVTVPPGDEPIQEPEVPVTPTPGPTTAP